MNPVQWYNQNKGQTHLNPDPSHGIDGECVNCGSSWSLFMGGPELVGDTAFHVWQNFRHPFYQVIPGSDRQPGDLVFLAPNNAALQTGPAGHVYVSTGGNGGLDCNWGGDRTLHSTTHSTTGVLGVFRKVVNSAPAQGVDMVDENTALRLAYYVYGFNGFNGKPNAFDDGAGTAATIKQFAPLIGKPTNDVLQQMSDDQYGQAFKNDVLIPALKGNAPANASVLGPGYYKVN